jgi:hypothetical protein
LVGTQTELLAGLAAAVAAAAFLEQPQLLSQPSLEILAAQQAALGGQAAAVVALPASRGRLRELTSPLRATAAQVVQMSAAAEVVAVRQ